MTHFSGQLSEAQNGEQVRVAGLVTTVRPYVTKAGKPMGFVTIEDIQGIIELVLFPRAWEKTRMQLSADQIVIVDGKVDTSNTPPKILVDAIRTDLEAAAAEREQGTACVRTRPDDSHRRRRRPPAGGCLNQAEGSLQRRSRTASRGAWGAKPSGTGFRQKMASLRRPRTSRPTGKHNGSHHSTTRTWRPVPQLRAMAASAANSPAPPSPTRSLRARGGVRPDSPFATRRCVQRPRPTESAVFAASGGNPPRIPALPSLYVPLAEERTSPDHPPKQITILLRSTGDRERDRRRIKTIHGTLISFHGKDRFSFHIFEDGRGVLLDFPAATTHVCTEMLARLEKLMGEASWRVEDITFH